jgi:predicted enzyme related to lactoylglutathione lyase
MRAGAQETSMATPFVHVELHTNDLPKAKSFYSRLFDWKLEDTPMPGGRTYTMIGVGEGTGGGMMKGGPPGSPARWQAYVLVNDVAASTGKAKELGATIMMDKTEVADFGFMSVIVDPTGAALALWEPKHPQEVDRYGTLRAINSAMAWRWSASRAAPSRACTTCQSENSALSSPGSSRNRPCSPAAERT